MPAQQATSFHHIRTEMDLSPARTLPEASLRRVAEEALLRVARRPLPRAPRPRAPLPRADAAPSPEAGEVALLCDALLQTDASVAWHVLDGFRAAGRSKSEIGLGHFPEAARRLGAMWERDEVSFAQVGRAVGRLQQLYRTLRAEAGPRRRDPVRRALFATLPGETHTLGVIIAADACRQRGWEVELSLGQAREAFLAELSEGSYPVLGLSLGSNRIRAELASLLAAIRAAAPDTRVLLSGPLVASSPLRARQLPADAWADDVPSALEAMDRLLDAAPRPETA